MCCQVVGPAIIDGKSLKINPWMKKGKSEARNPTGLPMVLSLVLCLVVHVLSLPGPSLLWCI